jgi:hypothetical protein
MRLKFPFVRLSKQSFFIRIPVVESALGMELVLNLVWVALAICMVCLWLRFAPRSSAGRRTQLAALGVLLLILLPAISITDDLLAAQNTAEVDNCLRRAHEFTFPHSIFSSVAASPLSAFAGLSFGVSHKAAPGGLSTPLVQPPALFSVQDRAPPSA